MANKRKKTTAIVAGVTAVALLLGGTFAWTSISQQAKNESAGIVNVGGRLHDDFNGTNKDVYVENFTDPLNGGQPIYARVRLDEYMEVGKEAGQADNADRNAVPVVENTDINDVETWIPHTPETDCAVCATEGTCAIHDHWEWVMGGQTTFMPTFNKDKDSLAADINGTYQGTDDTDKIYYDDYVVYTTDSANGGNNIAEADKETYDGNIYSVIGTEYYDDDTDTDDNGGTRQVADVTHTAKLTADGTVMTMTEWLANPVPGNFWVYDTDGWAYWANPIMPGEATGLLLSNINMKQNPGEKCYYAINVVGQFATVNDWEYFTDSTPSAEAMELLNIASQNVPTVTISNDTNVVAPGETLQFSAAVNQGAVMTLADAEVEWSLYAADGTPYEGKSSINTDGLLTVDKEEADGNILTVVARSVQYLGAVGMKSITVTIPDITMEISTANDLTIYEEGTAYNEILTAAVSGKDVKDGTLTWSVADTDGNALTETTITAGDNNTAELLISDTETAMEIVITAKYELFSGYEVVSTYVISKNMDITTTDNMEATAYAILTDDGTGSGYTMSFVRSAEAITTDNTYNQVPISKVYTGFESNKYTADYYSTPLWYRDNRNGFTITGIEFTTNIKPQSTAVWFYWLSDVKTIAGLDKLDISNVTDVSRMFYGMESMNSLDLSHWDVSRITNMYGLFGGCDNLNTIKMNNWDVSNVTDMGYMFSSIKKLTELDVADWNVSNVKNMKGMFSSFGSFSTLDLTSWDVSSVENMDYMFSESSLIEVDLTGWDVSNVKNMGRMFLYCDELQTIEGISNWNTSSLQDISLMFQGCKKLTQLDLSKWDVSHVTETSQVFNYCNELTTVGDLSNWNTSNFNSLNTFFYNCSKLEYVGDISEWNTAKVDNMRGTFYNCAKLNLNLSGWDTTSVGTAYESFNDGASGITPPTWTN